MRFFHIKDNLDKDNLDKNNLDKNNAEIVKNGILFQKKDCMLIMAVLFAAAISALMAALLQNDTGQIIRISIDGEIYGEYPLTDNQTITIEGPFGNNRIVIKNETAYMEEADCPDKYCMDYKPVSKGNETIICLPHRLVVEVIGKSDVMQPDVIVQ